MISKDEVISHLKILGVTELSASDKMLVDLLIDLVVSRICNACNVSSVPDGLHAAAVLQVCGEFLSRKKQLGKLEGFDLDSAVKQIQEGDTSITFAIGDGDTTPEQRIDALIQWMTHYGDDQLHRYRKLVW